MRKSLYRAFSVLMIVAVLVSSTMTSFASGTGAAVGKFAVEAFGGWLIGATLDQASNFVQDHIGYSAGKQCKSSSDGYHHCESSAFGSGLHGEDENGRFSSVVCRFCGELFKYYSSFGRGGGAGFGGKSDLEQSYSAQVSALPANGIDSSGGLIYSVPFTYVRVGWNVTNNYPHCYISFGDDNKPGTATIADLESEYEGSVSLTGTSTSFDIEFGRTYLDMRLYWAFGFIQKAPITGTYIPIQKQYAYNYWGSDGKHTKLKDLWDSNYQMKSYYCTKNSDLPRPSDTCVSNSDFSVRVAVAMPLVSFQVTPDDTSIVQGDTYNVNSRPTSITGDYGIIGDNGQITKVEGNTIVNETNNTYYNPATGTSDTITDWSYNYEDRSYNLTLGGGTTSTVTYGDENVTIQEGDTTYNVYYLVEQPVPDPTTCNHNWTETSSTPPTCTVPGSKVFTCSLCGQTKIESTPAPGHTWQIKQTVQTQYDETGQLTQQGYTIFECSVCHEQYKSEDSTAPPGDTGSPDDGSGFLESLAQRITSTLESVLETVTSIFDSVPSFFDGFLAFLSAMFPFLPKEIITLLTFGIAAVVFIGIIKAFRR